MVVVTATSSIVNHNFDSVLSHFHVDLLDQCLWEVIEAHGGNHLLVVDNDVVHACVLQVFGLRPDFMSPPKNEWAIVYGDAWLETLLTELSQLFYLEFMTQLEQVHKVLCFNCVLFALVLCGGWRRRGLCCLFELLHLVGIEIFNEGRESSKFEVGELKDQVMGMIDSPSVLVSVFTFDPIGPDSFF